MDFSRIQKSLMGLGAGFSGNGVQYMRQQKEEEILRQQAERERQQQHLQSIGQDFRIVNQHLQRGNTDRAVTVLNERITNTPQGQSMANTQLVRELINAGKIQEARQYLDGLDMEFTTRGILPPAAQAETTTVNINERLVNPNTGEIVLDADPQARTQTRQMHEDTNGILRYVDNGEPVFPGIEKITEGLDPKDYDQIARAYRGEISKANQDFVDIANSWDRIAASADDPSAAGDLALIFNYMKMLDPGSTVREGEFANAQNAAGVGQRIVGMYNRLLDGERLTPPQRQDFFGQAQAIFDATKERATYLEDQIIGIAQRQGIKPEDLRIGRGPDPVINPVPANTPTITSQAEYDQLPPGSLYYGTDRNTGRTYLARKP